MARRGSEPCAARAGTYTAAARVARRCEAPLAREPLAGDPAELALAALLVSRDYMRRETRRVIMADAEGGGSGGADLPRVVYPEFTDAELDDILRNLDSEPNQRSITGYHTAPVLDQVLLRPEVLPPAAELPQPIDWEDLATKFEEKGNWKIIKRTKDEPLTDSQRENYQNAAQRRSSSRRAFLVDQKRDNPEFFNEYAKSYNDIIRAINNVRQIDKGQRKDRGTIRNDELIPLYKRIIPDFGTEREQQKLYAFWAETVWLWIKNFGRVKNLRSRLKSELSRLARVIQSKGPRNVQHHALKWPEKTKDGRKTLNDSDREKNIFFYWVSHFKEDDAPYVQIAAADNAEGGADNAEGGAGGEAGGAGGAGDNAEGGAGGEAGGFDDFVFDDEAHGSTGADDAGNNFNAVAAAT